MSNSPPRFQRQQAAILAERLEEPRRFLQVVAGPRQVGKTTLVEQVLAAAERPTVYASVNCASPGSSSGARPLLTSNGCQHAPGPGDEVHLAVAGTGRGRGVRVENAPRSVTGLSGGAPLVSPASDRPWRTGAGAGGRLKRFHPDSPPPLLTRLRKPEGRVPSGAPRPLRLTPTLMAAKLSKLFHNRQIGHSRKAEMSRVRTGALLFVLPVFAAGIAPSVDGRGDGPETSLSEGVSLVDPQQLFDEAYKAFHRGDLRRSEELFQSFVDRFPESDLADNALFWVGEARFAAGDIEGALEALKATAERFPDGNKAPDALLRAASALERLGDADRARAIYDEVSRRFPRSAAARTAEQRRSGLTEGANLEVKMSRFEVLAGGIELGTGGRLFVGGSFLQQGKEPVPREGHVFVAGFLRVENSGAPIELSRRDVGILLPASGATIQPFYMEKLINDALAKVPLTAEDTVEIAGSTKLNILIEVPRETSITELELHIQQKSHGRFGDLLPVVEPGPSHAEATAPGASDGAVVLAVPREVLDYVEGLGADIVFVTSREDPLVSLRDLSTDRVGLWGAELFQTVGRFLELGGLPAEPLLLLGSGHFGALFKEGSKLQLFVTHREHSEVIVTSGGGVLVEFVGE